MTLPPAKSDGQSVIDFIATETGVLFPKLFKLRGMTIPHCSDDGQEGFMQIYMGVEGSGASILTLMRDNMPHVEEVKFWHQESGYSEQDEKAGQRSFRYVEAIKLYNDQTIDYSVTHHIPYQGKIIGNVQARGSLAQERIGTHSLERTPHDPAKPKVLLDSVEFVKLMGAMITHKKGEPYFADSVQLAMRPGVK